MTLRPFAALGLLTASLLACGRIDFARDIDTGMPPDATPETGVDGGMDAAADSSAPTPVCGDGVKEGEEGCDDGNREALDGCDPECRSEFVEVGTCTSDEMIVVLGPRTAESTYPTLVAYPSDGEGGFGPAETVATGMDLRAMALGNFDTRPEVDLLYRDVGTGATYLATCSDGTLWRRPSGGGSAGRAWADYDGDGCVDYLDFDYPCCSYGESGTGAGTTYAGDCAGGFTPLPTCEESDGARPCTNWDVTFLTGLWQAATPYNGGDWNGDGVADYLLASLSSGGDAPSVLWQLEGDGAGDLGAAVSFGMVSEPSNPGDLGDIDGDGCIDWVLGPNDDGEAAAVWAAFGDCAGGVRSAARLLSLCTGACYGDGQVVLYDWNGDGALDVTGTATETRAGRAQLNVWMNAGDGTFATPVVLTSGYELDSTTVRAPLRSPDR